jgi:glycosyltransferase involved in cell wall biosynthesis
VSKYTLRHVKITAIQQQLLMRIGLDGLPLTQQLTGVGYYTLELARALAEDSPDSQFNIISPRPYVFQNPTLSGRDGLPPNITLVRARTNLVTRRWWSIGLPRYLAKHSLDVFHGTNFEVPLWTNGQCATVITIHDLSLLLHPRTHLARSVRRAQRRLPRMAAAATLIITPTKSVRDEVCEHLGIAREKVFAVPEAARRVFRPMALHEATVIRRRLRISDDFLLFVGTIEPRKDLRTLLQTFEEVAQVHKTLQLVIAGKRGWLVEDLLKQIGESSFADRIKLTGYLNDEELRALYSSCRIFVYPSIYEGFGLPPLEAMACGAPVIASRATAVVEACGEAALLIEPRSVRSLIIGINKLLDDQNLRSQLIATGRRRAAQTSWSRTAELTRTVYEEAIKRFRERHA